MRNELDKETSPYLLQHKDNPVHWQTWSEDTIAAARAADKPILLSVGYAACHWCHVMAHESFEDPDTAAVMNELFVNVKVDREERPDLDMIFQTALAITGQQGGWPLTMFLTPEGAPFWGGTYFPPEQRYGRPSFREVMHQVEGVYREAPGRVAGNVTAISQRLDAVFAANPGDGIPLEAAPEVARHFLSDHDPVLGGIGDAPKFPQPTILKFLWRTGQRTGDGQMLQAVRTTMTAMCEGGIYDHLGGGFARYSTDAEWLVPHFEKMLYDNAQLLALMTEMQRQEPNPLYEQRIRETVDWLFREMLSEGGGFASSLDADSEGKEGKFYVWSVEEIERALTEGGHDAALFASHYDVTEGGNWEGSVILNRSHRKGPFDAETEERLSAARAHLLKIREDRIRPGWDDKVLADWNGLTIAALADAAILLAEPQWLDRSETAFAFIVAQMEKDGRLLHSWRAGQAKHTATLDDYANMSLAALALEAATGKRPYLDKAIEWAALLEDHFLDLKDGAYFFTADHQTDLMIRTKTAIDNVTPAGNSTMVEVLARLWLKTGDAAYAERAEAITKAFAGSFGQQPLGFPGLLNGLEWLRHGRQIVVAGDPADEVCQALLDTARTAGRALGVLDIVTGDESLPEGHPARGKGMIDGKPAAYLCAGQTCSPAESDPEQFRRVLEARP
ncbi:thioredoxin domain-containing protein [Nisaea acidiphila]|uniref:Thioredoxin domain-containing protein n=1 Tax=Nisaea acidiphila TaxID=1862145 RepID=A0A9J7ARK4_9PROT|nr:thioredoxin domain-containing protein [Nisaea acidiphila]UUX47941.1 thioredoxin domain-containing protein [Nisaea acidiphila]